MEVPLGLGSSIEAAWLAFVSSFVERSSSRNNGEFSRWLIHSPSLSLPPPPSTSTSTCIRMDVLAESRKSPFGNGLSTLKIISSP